MLFSKKVIKRAITFQKSRRNVKISSQNKKDKSLSLGF